MAGVGCKIVLEQRSSFYCRITKERALAHRDEARLEDGYQRRYMKLGLYEVWILAPGWTCLDRASQRIHRQMFHPSPRLM